MLLSLYLQTHSVTLETRLPQQPAAAGLMAKLTRTRCHHRTRTPDRPRARTKTEVVPPPLQLAGETMRHLLSSLVAALAFVWPESPSFPAQGHWAPQLSLQGAQRRPSLLSPRSTKRRQQIVLASRCSKGRTKSRNASRRNVRWQCNAKYAFARRLVG
jgi:hypothetical protein